MQSVMEEVGVLLSQLLWWTRTKYYGSTLRQSQFHLQDIHWTLQELRLSYHRPQHWKWLETNGSENSQRSRLLYVLNSVGQF